MLTIKLCINKICQTDSIHIRYVVSNRYPEATLIALNHDCFFTYRFILYDISLELSINKTQTFIYCSNCNVLLKINKVTEIHELVPR